MISDDEAVFLERLAAALTGGCVVEIGSWRGRSAIALARGAAKLPAGRQAMVYCIEPHAAFTGIFGGKFGPADRTAFYQAMLSSGMSEAVALINLPSLHAAKSWHMPIALLFIDGDHSEAAVQADVDAWAPHLTDEALLVFDDALDPRAGPVHVIARLVAGGGFREIGRKGKIVALQRVPDAQRAAQQRWLETIRAELRQGAQAAGYDGEKAMLRLAYGSFVSPKRRYMYIETPKAACTSFKHLIARVQGFEPFVTGQPYSRETRIDMLIHQRRHFAMPTLLDVDDKSRHAIMTRGPGWMTFALVRNPFGRVVSFFENKLRLGEPGYRNLEARFGDIERFGGLKQAFSAFVNEVITRPELVAGDAHLRPQSDLILLDFIPYTHIFWIESLREAISVFGQHLAKSNSPLPPMPRALNRSQGHDWRSYYDEQTAAIVAQAYRRDFDRFGYKPAEWKPPAAGAKNSTISPEEDHWRGEIVARNAMIDKLYDHLRVPKASLPADRQFSEKGDILPAPESPPDAGK